MDGYKWYIRKDANNIIIYRYSGAFDTVQSGDICVNQDGSRHYNDPYTNDRGQFMYKWDGANQIPRTQAELDAEWSARPIPPNPDTELANAINSATTLDELKKALTGTNGKLAKVIGKLK